MDALKKAQFFAAGPRDIKTNRFDAGRDELTYAGPRPRHSPPESLLHGAVPRRQLAAWACRPGIVAQRRGRSPARGFFAWLAWAAGTDRPGQAITYTSNWPYDPLVGNQADGGRAHLVHRQRHLLILFLGVAIFLYARYMHED